MRIELITIGTELLLGDVVNTNAAWLGAELAARGFPLDRQSVIADDVHALEETVRNALGRADLVFTTGGLGPTSDDLTRPVIAELFGAPLEEHPQLLERIHLYFAGRDRPVPAAARVQALVPMGAEILPNDWGTAPGLVLRAPAGRFQARPVALIMLPGPPRESGPMFAARVEALLRERIGECLLGGAHSSLEEAVVAELRRRQQTLTVAESCTGGLLAHRITNVPGASEVFLEGYVTYSNAAKRRLLGVPPGAIEAHGAVSEPVARAMAEGARQAAGSDWSLSITGIAGPGGGSPEKPVGTVFIGLAGEGGTAVVQGCHAASRVSFKELTVQQALDLLRRTLARLRV